MKKKLSLFLVVCVLLSINAYCEIDEDEIKYRRSSLHVVLMESEHFPHYDTVINAYYKTPLPDNYNDHRIEQQSFNPFDYGAEEGLLGQDIDESVIIERYFKENRVANQLVAKWFNRSEKGCFNMELIAERGHYNASEMDAHIALGSARGLSSIADAGLELLRNTFVVVNKVYFLSNEIPAAIIFAAAEAAAEAITNETAKYLALEAAERTYERAKEGYSVWTTSYLYRLRWDERTEAIFYQDLWMSEDNICEERKHRFDTTDIFQLDYIGSTRARTLVTFSFREERTDVQMIELATVRNIEKAYSSLQKEYDVFKPKVPLLSVDPLSARIGKKEGLTGRERFVVLEQVVCPNTGLTKYEQKGRIRVDGNNIWDNRFDIVESLGNDTVSKGSEQLNKTLFRGRSRGLYPGMLLRME